MILRLIAAFLISAGFGVLFKVPKQELVFCGLTGLLGYSVLEITNSAFYATATVSLISLSLAKARQNISTMYLVTGIIPYVPGGSMYRTMYYLVFDMPALAIAAGIHTFTVAGSIALGVILVLASYKVLLTLLGAKK